MKTEQKNYIRHQEIRKKQQQQITTTNLFRRRLGRFLNNGSDEAIIRDFHCQLLLLLRMAFSATTSSESELSIPAPKTSALIIIIIDGVTDHPQKEIKKYANKKYTQSRMREQSYSARPPSLRSASTYCLHRRTRDNSTRFFLY